ncbi:MAG: phage terminase large subunit [Anaerolineales bacterium]
MARKKFSEDKMAQILVEAAYRGDYDTAAKYGIHIRTVQRWRDLSEINPRLSRLIAEKKIDFERGWADEWRVIRLPAIAEADDPLERVIGEPLNPDRYPLGELEKIKTVMGSWAFEALFQQRPMPAEGGMFKGGWLKFVDAAPAQVTARVRYWDKAATADGGDYTAGVRMSRTTDGLYYIEDVTRGRWSSGERDKEIKRCAETDPPGTQIWLEQEPGSSGVDSVQALIRMLAGHNVRADRVTGSKVVRAGPLAAQAEVGNVALVRGAWNAAFLDELTSFPNGTHDDQVDAASGAFAKLTLSGMIEYGDSIWR